jgi:Na+-driven multidrug efflux pump
MKQIDQLLFYSFSNRIDISGKEYPAGTYRAFHSALCSNHANIFSDENGKNGENRAARLAVETTIAYSFSSLPLYLLLYSLSCIVIYFMSSKNQLRVSKEYISCLQSSYQDI